MVDGYNSIQQRLVKCQLQELQLQYKLDVMALSLRFVCNCGVGVWLRLWVHTGGCSRWCCSLNGRTWGLESREFRAWSRGAYRVGHFDSWSQWWNALDKLIGDDVLDDRCSHQHRCNCSSSRGSSTSSPAESKIQIQVGYCTNIQVTFVLQIYALAGITSQCRLDHFMALFTSRSWATTKDIFWSSMSQGLQTSNFHRTLPD